MGGEIQWGFCEQVALRAGQLEAGQHGVGIDSAAVAGDVRGKVRDAGAAAAHIGQNGARGDLGCGERAVHVRL